ncbi:hypothetical protein QZH41_019156 [Actinostola sp. cb2023]|nr:hypothetical protein QZH41_019156 [Actinostola sp. cb2023]
MLEEAKNTERNLEIRVEKLSRALEVEKSGHSTSREEGQEFWEKYTLLLGETRNREQVHKQRMKEVNDYYRDLLEQKNEETQTFKQLLTETEQGKDEEVRKVKKMFDDLELSTKSEMNSKDLLIDNLKASLSEASKVHDQKLGDMERTCQGKTVEKDTELSGMKKAVGHLKQILEQKKHELSLENEAHELICQKYKEDLEMLNESQAESLRSAEREKEELKHSMKKSVDSKEGDLQEIIRSSNDALAKKDEIITGFKQFVQETAVKNQTVLSEKDEVIRRMKQYAETLSKELKTHEQTLNSREDEIGKLKTDHQFGFSVLVKKCSDMEEKLHRSNETRIKAEESSRNVLKEFQVKMRQKDKFLEVVQIDLKKERRIKEELEKQLENSNDRLKKEELLIKEAGKIIKNVTEEKNDVITKLNEKNRKCDELQRMLTEKDSFIKSLKQAKVTLGEENESLNKNNSKLQEKIKKKEKKVAVIEIERKRLKSVVLDLQQKNNKAGKLNIAIKERLDWMSIANQDNEQSMKQLKLTSKKNNEEKNALLNKLTVLESQKRQHEKRMKDLKHILMEKETLLADLKQTLQDLKSHKDALEKNIATLQYQVQERAQDNFTMQAKVKELTALEQTLVAQKAEIERIKDDEINGLRKELEGLRLYLSQGEQIITNVSRERDGLMQELETSLQTHKDVAQTMESYNNCLRNDKNTLEEKLKRLDSTVVERYKEIGDLKNSLNSAEISNKFLSEKVNEMSSLKQDLVKEKEHNDALKNQLREGEKMMEKDADEGRKRSKKSEEVFLHLRHDYQNLESVLREKETELTNSHKTNNKIMLENEELNELVNNTCRMNKEMEHALIAYKDEAETLEAAVAHLKTDNEFLEDFAKEAEKTKFKLESTEDREENLDLTSLTDLYFHYSESLRTKSNELAELKEKLSMETKHNSTLQNEVRDNDSTRQELKDRYEIRIKASEREIKELRVMLDERNREISLIKMERNNFEIKQRETELKVLELTNTLRGETSYEQNMVQRNKELELELRKVQHEKRLGLLASSVESQTSLRGIPLHDVATERRLQQKVDNIAIDKLRTLHTKVTQLEIQLEQERHDRVKEHAEVARLRAELAVYKSIQ